MTNTSYFNFFFKKVNTTGCMAYQAFLFTGKSNVISYDMYQLNPIFTTISQIQHNLTAIYGQEYNGLFCGS